MCFGVVLAHMQIAFRGADMVVPHQLFNRMEINATFDQVGGKGMTQTMDAAFLVDMGMTFGGMK